ncbi:hypothetical protein A3715_26880 [Oleiphilus sp. HI0009]|nr:hypothetical protein A3715_18165 [Oleiphilus sp. HI0009]KZX86370.1 hypothetical protein A3715_26880 [Oleiphilus sp. HI0009]
MSINESERDFFVSTCAKIECIDIQEGIKIERIYTLNCYRLLVMIDGAAFSIRHELNASNDVLTHYSCIGSSNESSRLAAINILHESREYALKVSSGSLSALDGTDFGLLRTLVLCPSASVVELIEHLLIPGLPLDETVNRIAKYRIALCRQEIQDLIKATA